MLLGAVASLSFGATITRGTLSGGVTSMLAIASVVVSVLLTGVALRASGRAAGRWPWSVAVALCAAAAFVFPLIFAAPAEAGLTAGLVVSVVIAVVWRARVSWAAAGVAALVVMAMAGVAWRWGTANIDVFHSVQNASAAVLHGANPYTTTFSTPVLVGPGHFVDRTVHFQYLPAAALLVAPARLLGDVRLMSVVAFAVLIAFALNLASQAEDATPRRLRVLALCLALPLTVPMILFAWVDVYSVMGFAGWVALRHTHRRWAIACLAISLAIKPTIVVALVPALVWSQRARKETMLAVAAVVILVLPFAFMTGFAAFYQDVVGIQTQLGFRYDGLTLGAGWYALTGQLLPVWFGPVAGGPIAFFALRRRPRDLQDVLISGALLCTAGFLLAKWAFLNYYFIPVWLLVLALAARGIAFDSEAETTLPALVRSLSRLELRLAPAQRAPLR